jgi:AraC-like DNA-binding protein
MEMVFPCSKSIGFHIVTQGEAILETPEQFSPVTLKRGDIAWISRGYHHRIRTVHDMDTPLTLISGAYQFWNTPVHPLFKEIPATYFLRTDEINHFDQLDGLVRLLSQEANEQKIGSATVIQGLLDILFSLIARRIIDKAGTRPQGWAHAVQNDRIKKSLELMHSDLQRNWSLDELARQAGMSRAGFASTFKKMLGDTPLHYLTMLRVQKAMGILSATNDNLEAVALAVGYKDAFGFSKVFKRIVGVPPKEFRAVNRKDNEFAFAGT